MIEDWPDGPAVVKRAGTSAAVNTRGEAAGLRWLADAEAAGGARIPRVHAVDERRLVIERIATGTPTRDAARRFGAALARTHAAGAEWFGAPPPGWSGPLVVGRSRTPLVARNEAPARWGEFFARYRLRSYLRVLVDRGDFARTEAAVLERVAARLEAGEFDAPQPRLVLESGAVCARLHGDLWSGNVLWLADAGRCQAPDAADPGADPGAALIDPMAHGGHAETDLALLALFGLPHLDDVLAGYNAASPLADGWRQRVGLHQLTPLLLHCVLFGGGYLGETLTVARTYA